MEIIIDSKLKEKCPDIALGCIIADVDVFQSDDDLTGIIESYAKQFEQNYKDMQLSTLDEIKAARGCYRTLGKDPTKYRVSSEALARRVVKGKGLYKINNVVDINNLISLTTLYPVCSYDLEKLEGDIRMTYVEAIDDYQGISRGTINVANMPVVMDKQGIFGSTTSDSERAKITDDTKKLFLKIVSFQGPDKLESCLRDTLDLLEEFCNCRNSMKMIIK